MSDRDGGRRRPAERFRANRPTSRSQPTPRWVFAEPARPAPRRDWSRSFRRPWTASFEEDDEVLRPPAQPYQPVDTVHHDDRPCRGPWRRFPQPVVGAGHRLRDQLADPVLPATDQPSASSTSVPSDTVTEAPRTSGGGTGSSSAPVGGLRTRASRGSYDFRPASSSRCAPPRSRSTTRSGRVHRRRLSEQVSGGTFS